MTNKIDYHYINYLKQKLKQATTQAEIETYKKRIEIVKNPDSGYYHELNDSRHFNLSAPYEEAIENRITYE